MSHANYGSLQHRPSEWLSCHTRKQAGTLKAGADVMRMFCRRGGDLSPDRMIATLADQYNCSPHSRLLQHITPRICLCPDRVPHFGIDLGLPFPEAASCHDPWL